MTSSRTPGTATAPRRPLSSDTLAASETDPGALQRLADSGDPQVLRQLARNPAAPDDLLRRLADVKGIKHAADIRALARRALTDRGRTG